MDQTLLTAMLVFAAVAFGTVSVVFLGEFLRNRLRARNVVKQLQRFAEDTLDDDGRELFRRSKEHQGALDPVLHRIPSLQDVAILLDRGRTPWSLSTFFLLTLGLALGFGLATFLLTHFLPGAVVAAAIGALLPYFYVKRRASKRLGKFEEQLPDAIDLIGRAIRAGHPLSAGFKMVADEAKDPVAEEFRRVFEEQRFGLDFSETMFGLADRVPLVDTRILVTAVLVQREVGGNLAEILDNLAYVIRERFKIRRQLRVITAQGRLSGYILACLPIAVGLAIFFLNRSYIMELFTEEVGKFMLVAAIVLQISGYLWIRKIVNIEI
jgi:tight adherence protein B